MKFKKLSTMLSEMKDYTLTNTRKLNDFSPGSAIRAVYEAVGIQLEEYRRMMRENMKESSEQGTYESFKITRRESQTAYGPVTIRFQNPLPQGISVPRGSRFASRLEDYPQTFETLEEYTIQQGATSAEVTVYATQPGTYGNIPEGVIDIMHSPVANTQTVTNREAFRTGQDEEPLDELNERFQSYLKSLGKAIIDSVEYGIRTVPEVSGVYTTERPGIIFAYVHDQNGDLPDSVKEKIEQTIIDYRAGGIKVDVRPVVKRLVDVNVDVTLNDRSRATPAFRKQIEQQISHFLDNMEVDNDFIPSALIRRIGNIDRRLIYDIQIKEPEETLDIAENELIRAGNIQVRVH